MTIKVLMGQLWPDAGGRTRAVFVRNQNIYQNISKDIELLILDRADDLQERIVAANKRFKSHFRIKALFQEIRYLPSMFSGNYFTNDKIVLEHVGNGNQQDFVMSGDEQLVTLYRDHKKVVTFWNSHGLSEYVHSSNNKDILYYLIHNAKVIVGYRDDIKIFRLVNDAQGKLMSFGSYDDKGHSYKAERFFNVLGETIFEFTVLNGKRVYSLYLGSGASFSGENAEKDLVAYLRQNYVTVTNEDSLIIDEPRFYGYGLKLGAKNAERFFYFHWHNYGKQEQLLLQDKTVNKTAVFLTENQQQDFLLKADAHNNKSLRSVVIDNVLEPADDRVTRSADEAKRVLFIGRLAPEKNVSRVVKVFAEFKQFYPAAQLTIIGDGPDRKQLEDLSQSLNLGASVTFVGNLKFPYESEHFHIVDLAVLLPNYEAYGLVFPELISRGIPVVTIDAPYGPSRWIKENKNGKLLDVQTSDRQVAEAMERIIKLELDPDEVSSTINIDLINKSVEEKIIKLTSKNKSVDEI